jgi:arginase
MVDVSWSPELAGILPLVAPPDVRVLGARDAGDLEAEGVPSIGGRVHVVDASHLAADPAGDTEAACASFTDPWWFHLDLDVLSTAALPAVDYRQDGGLGWDELDEVGETALRARPVGWDVTIYNPDLDPERIHARRIVRFLASAVRVLTT